MSLSDSPVSPRAEPSKTHRIWFLRDLAVGVIVPSTLGAFGAGHQLLDLCSNFRLQYLALLCVLAVLLWRMRSPRWAAIALLAVLQNAALVGPYYWPVNSVGRPTAKLSLVSFNVHTANRNCAAVLEYLNQKNPDVILLIEVDHRWIRELDPLRERYPHTALAPQADNFGIAVFSKLPITRQEILSLGPEQPLSVWAELDLEGRQVGFLGAHPWPPMTPAMFRSRNEQLAATAEKVKSAEMPTIVAGDFNATPWCVGFRPLIDAGLTDTALGFGVQRTWNSKIPLMWIPIDHVLATKEFTTLRRSVGPHCGSDHFAVEAELGLP